MGYMGFWRGVTLGCLLAVSTADSVSALYVPNPAARWEQHRFFLAGDFQFNTRKELDSEIAGSNRLKDTYGVFARPGFSIAENVMVYGRVGVQAADNVDVGLAFGGGIQAAYAPEQYPEIAVGVAFDYLHWSADFENDGPDIEWNEFQLTPGVSYMFEAVPLTPYVGLALDFVDARGSANADHPVGFVFGTNYDPIENLRLDLQVRTTSETGFLASIGYLF